MAVMKDVILRMHAGEKQGNKTRIRITQVWNPDDAEPHPDVVADGDLEYI